MGDGEDDHRSKINVASPTRTRFSKLKASAVTWRNPSEIRELLTAASRFRKI